MGIINHVTYHRQQKQPEKSVVERSSRLRNQTKFQRYWSRKVLRFSIPVPVQIVRQFIHRENRKNASFVQSNSEVQVCLKNLQKLSMALNPQAVGMAVAWPQDFEIDSRGHFTAKKIQNVIKVKFTSLALVFHCKFDHKLFSSLKIT